jgi:hypothetical protein
MDLYDVAPTRLTSARRAAWRYVEKTVRSRQAEARARLVEQPGTSVGRRLTAAAADERRSGHELTRELEERRSRLSGIALCLLKE